jgi:hypothetical protein
MDNDPRAEHILAHPYFIRGAQHERDQILNLMRTHLEASSKVIYAQTGFSRGVRVALEQLIQEIESL